MKKFLFMLAVAGLMAGFSGKSAAQDTNTADDALSLTLPEIKVLDLPTNGITLLFVAPEAGSPVAAVKDTSFINYTSIQTTSTHKITVALDSDVPSGTTLNLVAEAHEGTGGGSGYGTMAAEAAISHTARDLITAIPSCWTGDGPENGSKLIYTWSINSGYTAVASTGSRTATYTMILTP
ncbi:MAG: hypothetical protein WCJ95_03390 [Mariniphaga sp.]